MYRRTSVLAIVAVVLLPLTALGEKVPLSPEELKATATHIVVGQVTAISTRSETSGDWQYTHYVAEIRVAEAEKGDGLKKGELVYARYWQRRWISKEKQPPSTIGHRGLPSAGETLRVYLARNAYDGFGNTNDGGFNVIGANGFEPIKAAGK